MKLLFDASCLINLANGDLLDLLCSTPSYIGCLGQLSRDECVSNREAVEAQIVAGRLSLLPDLDMPAAAFGAMLRAEGLGPGETECLLLAQGADYVVGCDDRKARSRLVEQLGIARVTGTLGLLGRAVRDEVLGIGRSFESYEQMRRAGGFLPNLDLQQFARLLERAWVDQT